MDSNLLQDLAFWTVTTRVYRVYIDITDSGVGRGLLLHMWWVRQVAIWLEDNANTYILVFGVATLEVR